MLFIEYPPCSTCKKAKQWLVDHNIDFTTRHIKEDNPTADELAAWQEQSGLELKKFFNTSGLVYKSLNLKEKLPAMSREEQLALLATDGMLVKRPILVTDDTVLVGFKAGEWEKLLQNNRSVLSYPEFERGGETHGKTRIASALFRLSGIPSRPGGAGRRHSERSGCFRHHAHRRR